MPTLDWLRTAFHRGYSSGNLFAPFSPKRRSEERKAGASYRHVFRAAVVPHLRPDSTVLEIGPGTGSWSRAILKHIPRGKLITVDFLDVTAWLRPERYDGRLECHRVRDLTLSCVADGSVDFCWSFGVLCHNNVEAIEQTLRHLWAKMKPGGQACHQYGDWDKLDAFGWKRGHVPTRFRKMPDEAIWWPRNNAATMQQLATRTGWEVLAADLGLVQRDGLILLRRPG